MKSLLIASLALAALGSGAAIAADMPVKAPYLKAPPPVANWTGCYVGGVMGAKWDRVRTKDNGVTDGVPNASGGLALEDPFDFSGVFAGGTLGCNYQVTSWVFGLEGDISASDSVGSAHDVAPFNTLFQEFVRERWIATARARLGYLWTPDLLFYVTGGAAWSEFNTQVLAISTVNVNENDYAWGWTVGGGLEYLFPGTSWSGKFEYLYADFRSFNSMQFVPGIEFRNLAVSEHLFRVGLDYHFNWGMPVVAKY